MRRLKRSLAFLLTAVLLAALVPSAALAWTGPDVTAPEGHELVCFVDCGASTFPEEIQTLMAEYPDSVKNTTPDQAYTTDSVKNTTPDQAYTTESGWGYTNATDDTMVYYADSGDIYTSFRCFQETVKGPQLRAPHRRQRQPDPLGGVGCGVRRDPGGCGGSAQQEAHPSLISIRIHI